MSAPGPELKLTYSQTESLLAALNQVRPTKLSALRARLKHFKRLGFPPGVNTGRGRRADYGPGELVHLLLAFEMLQIGLTPERIREVLLLNRRQLAQGIRLAALSVLKHQTNDCPDIFVCVHPHALSMLSAPNPPDLYWRRAKDLLHLLKSGELEPRISLINVTVLIGAAANFLHDVYGMERTLFFHAIRAWSDDYEWDTHLGDQEEELADLIFGAGGEEE